MTTLQLVEQMVAEFKGQRDQAQVAWIEHVDSVRRRNSDASMEELSMMDKYRQQFHLAHARWQAVETVVQAVRSAQETVAQAQRAGQRPHIEPARDDQSQGELR